MRNLIVLAIAANLITVALFEFSKSQTGKSSFSSFSIALCIVGLWAITFIAALAHSRNKNLFQTKFCVWAFFIIQFCTPFPLLGAYSAFNPASGAHQSEDNKGSTVSSNNTHQEKLLIHNIVTPEQRKLYKTNYRPKKTRQ